MNSAIIAYAFKEDRVQYRSKLNLRDETLRWFWTWIRFSSSTSPTSMRRSRWSSEPQSGHTASVSLCPDSSCK